MNAITTKDLILSILHIRNIKDVILNFSVSALIAIFSYFNGVIIEHKHLFIAVTFVVIGDWIFGTIRAVKNNNWETQKALKLVYYLFAYYTILFIVISIKQAHASAFFISDAIVLPILLFQLCSMLKNMSLIGWIPGGLLLELLKNIDKHKEDLQSKIQEANGESIISEQKI